MLVYRDVRFEYNEWRTWNNQLACGYSCSDEKLLEGLNTSYFSAISLDEMHAKIDNYIDNRVQNLELQEINNKAIQEFYNTNHYKGD